MKHNKLFVLFSFLLLCMGILWSDPSSVSADEVITTPQPVTVEVTAESMNTSGARKTIQKALNTARDKASIETPYIIKVEPGTYTLTDGILHVYSNTTLDLTDVTIQRAGTSNMLRIGATDSGNTETGVLGYFYQNITIIGGTFDATQSTGTVIKAGHASNLEFQGCTFTNVNNAHLMEVAGVNDFRVLNCNFSNQIVNSSNDLLQYEALQFDIILYEHFAGYRSEPLACRNIKIDNCTFTNVPRGIGSHTAVLNDPLNGISITNCTFTNMNSAAIQGQDWINCTITNNKISETPRGIVLYSILNDGQGCYTADVLAEEGAVANTIPVSYLTPASNQNIVISNNTISLNDAKDPYVNYTRGGIIVSGGNMTKNGNYSDGSGQIPLGNYYISGVTIASNNITTTAHGIRLIDCQNSNISGNTVTGQKATGDSGTYYGIQARENCKSIMITNNMINNPISTGIFIAANSSAASITLNTITNAGKYGIDVEQSSATNITQNVVSSPAQNGIFVYYSSTVDKIKDNTITDSRGSGIYIVYKSTVNKVSTNNVSNSALYGVSVTESSKLTDLKSNSLFGSSVLAVNCDATSSITTDSKNYAFDAPVLVSAVNYATGVKVQWKKAANAKTYYIYRKIKGGSWKKIGSSTSNSYVDKKATSGVKYYYTVKVIENKKVRSLYNTTGISRYYVAAPKWNTLTGGPKKITVSWKKAASVTGYQVQYSTKKSFKSYKTKKITSAKKLTKTFSGLKKNKTYYVRIRSYRKTSSKTYYSGWSTVKKVVTK